VRRRVPRTARLVHRVLRGIRKWAEIPSGFRDWSEVEDNAASLRAWTPGIIHGLQTEDYAAAILGTSPGASDETVNGRLRARMAGQRRVILRDTPPAAWFIVDELALHRYVGSPAVMTAQARQLAALAAMPDITIQVPPRSPTQPMPAGPHRRRVRLVRARGGRVRLQRRNR
jgi:hypothetical protein